MLRNEVAQLSSCNPSLQNNMLLVLHLPAVAMLPFSRYNPDHEQLVIWDTDLGTMISIVTLHGIVLGKHDRIIGSHNR